MKKKGASQTGNSEQREIDENFTFMLNEAIPVSQGERKKYVSDIALFYNTVFKKKLKHFKGLQLEELAQIGRTELGSNIIRSNINCFELIGEWMETMSNEHVGNLEQMRQSFDEGNDIIKDLKDKYQN